MQVSILFKSPDQSKYTLIMSPIPLTVSTNTILKTAENIFPQDAQTDICVLSGLYPSKSNGAWELKPMFEYQQREADFWANFKTPKSYMKMLDPYNIVIASFRYLPFKSNLRVTATVETMQSIVLC